MTDKKSKYIGIDVGGTKILLQTFDEKLNMTEEIKAWTETKKGAKGFMDQIFHIIDRVFHKGISGIGIALPGIVNIHNGNLAKAPHLPTPVNFPIKSLLEKKYKTRVAVDNDINAFLLAEKEKPRLKKYNNVIAIMVGTGLGSAIITDGEMVYGKNGYAGEAGHIVINSGGELKTLEQNTSGFFVPKIAKQLGIKKKIEAKDLEKQTPDTKKIKDHMLKSLGMGLANLNLIFNPEVFILGGSIYRLFLSDRKKELMKKIADIALDGASPMIMDADESISPARGMVLYF
jgi:predicted NBD/HSP70 family sugar kinase